MLKPFSKMPYLCELIQHYTSIFVTDLGNQKYLVEQEGDETLFEDKGKVGRGFLTLSICFGQTWLNNEGSIGLKDKQRESIWMASLY